MPSAKITCVTCGARRYADNLNHYGECAECSEAIETILPDPILVELFARPQRIEVA